MIADWMEPTMILYTPSLPERDEDNVVDAARRARKYSESLATIARRLNKAHPSETNRFGQEFLRVARGWQQHQRRYRELLAETRQRALAHRQHALLAAIRRLPQAPRARQSRRVVRSAAKTAAKACADPDGPAEPPGRRALQNFGGAL